MTVKLCDICRKEIDMNDRDTISKISFGNYGIGSWIWHSEFDLCSECGKALTAWLNVRKSLSLPKVNNENDTEDCEHNPNREYKEEWNE